MMLEEFHGLEAPAKRGGTAKNLAEKMTMPYSLQTI
jgi:hypothetical protein